MVNLPIIAALASMASATTLHSYNVDPSSVSVSGISSGGFMAVQLGVAYSSVFQTGFGSFAGGPYDCARNQPLSQCTNRAYPSIEQPLRNMKQWSGHEIDPIHNLAKRNVFLHVGSADTVVGVNATDALKEQLEHFSNPAKLSYVITPGAEHTFPTDFDAKGDSSCSVAQPPFVSNCGYDGAGGVLQWMYGDLHPRNDGAATGKIVHFLQFGKYGALGMDTTGVLYVPKACQGGSRVCKLHVALHGCMQSQVVIGSTFVENTGYNKWADTNNIIILYPQTAVDDVPRKDWSGNVAPNNMTCWDFIGSYGDKIDQHEGIQVKAIVNMVKTIVSGFRG